MSNLFKTISLNRPTMMHSVGSLILCLGLSLAVVNADAERAIAASRVSSKSSVFRSVTHRKAPESATEAESHATTTGAALPNVAGNVAGNLAGSPENLAGLAPQELVQSPEPLAIAVPRPADPEPSAASPSVTTASPDLSGLTDFNASDITVSQTGLGLRTAVRRDSHRDSPGIADRLNSSGQLSFAQDVLTGQPLTGQPLTGQPLAQVAPAPTHSGAITTAQASPSTLASPAPIAQRNERPDRNAGTSNASDLGTVTEPTLRVQGVYLLEGDEDSIRGRIYGIYPLSSRAQIGAVIDVTDDGVFNLFEDGGVDITELYIAVAPFDDLPGLRFVAGQLDLTSYFDRNSFAKDRATHFFNSVFQTNQALSAANINSRPGVLLNWSINDNVEVRAAGFSGDADIGDFELNSFAGELGLRFENFIVRGTYVSTEDSESNTGFEEIFDIRRGDNRFGLLPGDKETAWGINAEYFISDINMGIFGRYGHYENEEIDRGADTFMAGISFLDLFMKDDRIGLGYGQMLSNADLRDGDRPDVWELFYDAKVLRNLRVGVTLQGRDEFSETVAGFRVRADFDLLGGDRQDDDEEEEES